MAEISNQYEALSSRAGFNAAVRHIKAAIALVEGLSPDRNFADAVRDQAAAGLLEGERLAALLRMVLVDKYGYHSASRNLETVAESLEALAEDFAAWNAVDLVFAYHHPDLGLVVANPKNAEQLASIGVLRKHELAVCFAGRLDKGSDDTCATAVALALDLLEGKRPTIPAAFLSGAFKVKKVKVEKPVAKAAKEPKKRRGAKPAAEKQAAVTVAPSPVAAPVAQPAPIIAAGGKLRMTPMYSVAVTNELFHNGNVEAWKRIIASYKAAHPSLEVNVYYDGERIMNINSLFKWGKVKHGSSIQFAVVGVDIKDVAKLQRYLMQGASPQFEAFLHGPVSTVLKLF